MTEGVDPAHGATSVMSDPPRATQGAQPQTHRAKIFRDPIHDLIYIGPDDDWVLRLIDTKEFQRLRRIRQLGLCHFVYPGAEHTRFVHSLGVFNFAQRMLRKLQHRHANDGDIADHLRGHERVVKAAALLHDLGHGPFSHVFERVFRGRNRRKHDEWSCTLIRDESTEVNQRLVEDEIDPAEVCGLISEREPAPAEPYMRDIVASQLDADRMDYLLRDSLMTGSRYGQFDSEWILSALAIGELRVGGESPKKLCLDASKGTGGIEGLLFARTLMLQHVYGHKTTRAYEAEMIQTYRLAMELIDFLPADTPAPVRTVLSSTADILTNDYLMLDDEVVWWALRRWAAGAMESGCDPVLGAALRRHALRLVRRQKPWRTVPELEGVRGLGAEKLIQHLSEEGNPLRFECHLDKLEDLPYKDIRYPVAEEDSAELEQRFFREVFLLRRDGSVGPLSRGSPSPILGALMNRVLVWRFHYDSDFEEEFSGLFKEFGVR